MHTWGIDDGQVGAKLVLNFDNNLLGPELLLALQSGILTLNIVLHSAVCMMQRSSGMGASISRADRVNHLCANSVHCKCESQQAQSASMIVLPSTCSSSSVTSCSP